MPLGIIAIESTSPLCIKCNSINTSLFPDAVINGDFFSLIRIVAIWARLNKSLSRGGIGLARNYLKKKTFFLLSFSGF